ncbi:MAG: PIN domain-containing protein [Anaerolineales bacterium]|nr:PIN domain-containing protein [Anaerolineales bacterium]
MSADEAPVFVDTNVLVYAYDHSAGEKYDRARFLLDQLWSDMGGHLSIQVLQEFYVTVTQKVRKPLDSEAAAGIVRDLSYWRIHVPVADDVVGAIDLQQRYETSFWDAMILWSAHQLGCSIVWSEDMSEGQDFDGVRVFNPFRD